LNLEYVNGSGDGSSNCHTSRREQPNGGERNSNSDRDNLQRVRVGADVSRNERQLSLHDDLLLRFKYYFSVDGCNLQAAAQRSAYQLEGKTNLIGKLIHQFSKLAVINGAFLQIGW
jgi:hypothetical protein